MLHLRLLHLRGFLPVPGVRVGVEVAQEVWIIVGADAPRGTRSLRAKRTPSQVDQGGKSDDGQ